jgi:hypothetical protein
MNAYTREWNVLLSEFRFPILYHIVTEFLVEWSRIRQETCGQQYVAYESCSLCLEAFTSLSPTDSFTGQSVDQSGGIVHLTSTGIGIINEILINTALDIQLLAN